MRKTSKIDRHPDPLVDEVVDMFAHKIVESLTPCALGLMLYPNAQPVALSGVPEHVIADHLNRYSKSDLETGQFLEVLPDLFTFIMSHETRKRIDKLK